MRKLLPPIKNKRGDFTGIIYLVVTVAVLAIVLLIGGYIADTTASALKEKISSDDARVNESFDATINVARNTLPAVWYAILAVMLLGLFITAWYMPTHPILVPVFIILLILVVIVGVAMSNAYEMLYEVEQLEEMAENQSSIYFIMKNLPLIGLVIGIIVLIVTFAKPGGSNAPIA